MSNRIEYGMDTGYPTLLDRSSEGVRLTRLLGIACGEEDGRLSENYGFLCLETDRVAISWNDFRLVESRFDEDSFLLTYRVGNTHLRFETFWQSFGRFGLWRRSDRIINEGCEKATVTNCQSRFSLSLSNVQLYSQDSRWCGENQGRWQDLRYGRVELGCEGGRTTEGCTPFACVRQKNGNPALGFHLVGDGNWTMHFHTALGKGKALDALQLEMGISGEALALILEPGQRLELPVVLIQVHPDGSEHSAAPHLHGFLLEQFASPAEVPAPVVFNTWLDAFDYLSVDRLRKQLDTAAKVGCEVFVVDAGWYGCGTGTWYEQTGDWRESEKRAFQGRMRNFADEVRGRGLGFGLWIEPERLCRGVPVLQEHPEWFFDSGSGFFYPDFCRREIRDYFLVLISSLIDRYGIAFLKIDFNFRIENDPHRTELSTYIAAFSSLLDDLRTSYPKVFFEGCSSGALRLDTAMWNRFCGSFLSDNTNPRDELRILQGVLLRLPPGRLTKWAVMRAAGYVVPYYDMSSQEGEWSVLTPCGATWERAETVDPDFAMKVALTGVPGVSGDLAGLPTAVLEIVRKHLEFYKRWRPVLSGAHARLLTPPGRIGENEGWIGIQLSDPIRDIHFLFAYRLGRCEDRRHFQLQGMTVERSYRVEDIDSAQSISAPFTGRELSESGVQISLPNSDSGRILLIIPGEYVASG